MEVDLWIRSHFLKYEEIFCSKHKIVEIGISYINSAHQRQGTRCCNIQILRTPLCFDLSIKDNNVKIAGYQILCIFFIFSFFFSFSVAFFHTSFAVLWIYVSPHTFVSLCMWMGVSLCMWMFVCGQYGGQLQIWSAGISSWHWGTFFYEVEGTNKSWTSLIHDGFGVILYRLLMVKNG